MSRAILPVVLGALLGGATVHIWNRSGTYTEVESLTANLLDTPSETSPSGQSVPTDTLRGDIAVDALGDDDSDSITSRAAADPESALTRLADIASPADQREVALVLVAALGDDDAAISRVSAMLPEADHLSFRIDALRARAQTDPGSALRSALALDSIGSRGLALAKIAEASTRVDANTALANVSLIADRELRAIYLAGVAETWAESDPTVTLTWLESAVPSELPAAGAEAALRSIAESNYDLLLAHIDSLSSVLRPTARQAAILALAERNPQAALAEIESLGRGRDITDLEGAVAEEYALVDPEAAVEWARNRPTSQTALEGAFKGAAAVDYDLAIDLALQALQNEPISSALALSESGAGPFSRFVDRLLVSDIPDHQQKFDFTMFQWSQVNAEAALQWAFDNMNALTDASLDPGVLAMTFAEGGRKYPELAMTGGDAPVPLAFRELWINEVAGGVAAADPDSALAFIERFRGEPGYEDGLNGIISTVAESDPVVAARLVERTGANAAGFVGRAWAQQDPAAASSWVAGLKDPAQRRDGVVGLAANWARTDATGAMEWLLELPEDEARDAGLQSAIPTITAATGSLDIAALDAIGDDQLRRRATMNAIISLGRTNPDDARQLADTYIENPSVRQQVLQRIAEQGGGIVSNFTSRVDIPR